MECQCDQEDNFCDLCCKDGADGKCQPIKSFEFPGLTEEKKAQLKQLKQFPGAPCNAYNGYCDVFLKCRAVDADGPLSRLKNKFFSEEAIKGYLEWIKTYWWAVVLMGVGLILLMAGKVLVGLVFRACAYSHKCLPSLQALTCWFEITLLSWSLATLMFTVAATSLRVVKDGASVCYCAYVLRISGYSGFKEFAP